MSSVTFDKLAYLESLKAAGVPEAQARAHALALDEALRETVATKSDLRELELSLTIKIPAIVAAIIGFFKVLERFF